jgi:Ca-activated chloride channel homolog
MAFSRDVCLCAGLAVMTVTGQEVTITPRARTQPVSYPRASLRADVHLVQIPVTVTDLHGKPLLDLRKADFRVFEDEIEKPISAFFTSDAPISAGVVFDSSRSMKRRLDDAREAVEQFLHTGAEGDEFFLIRFSDRAELLSPFTRDTGEISRQLGSVEAKGWTALTDSIVLAAHQSRKANNQRKVLLVISDGGDNNSRYSMGELIAFLREADVRVYAIGLIERPQFLAKVCEETGGRALWVRKMADLPEAMGQLSLEIRSEYVVGYTPDAPHNDGRYHRIRVAVQPPAGMARVHTSWRRGYIAPDE